MRALLFPLIVVFAAACSEQSEPQPPQATEPGWLSERPANAYPYAEETLAQFREFVEGDAWRDPAWNTSGTLEAVHERTGLVFVLVPGTGPDGFMMGSPEDEAERNDDEKRHRVTVPAFLLCKTECTQRAWDAVGGADGRRWKEPDLPIETVSWMAVEGWCRKAGLRLPSESEWEYACRAGTETPFWTGATLSTDQANYDEDAYCGGREGESRQRTVVCGSLQANPWGLHEMHGNVWERCQDWYEKSYDRTPKDGSAHEDSGSGIRVARGGCWYLPASGCRSAIRSGGGPGFSCHDVGFRPAASLSE